MTPGSEPRGTQAAWLCLVAMALCLGAALALIAGKDDDAGTPSRPHLPQQRSTAIFVVLPLA